MKFDEWFNSLTVEQKYDFATDGRGYKKQDTTLMRQAWDAAIADERKRVEMAIESLTRADYKPSNIWRHYYHSVNGEWVCLRELRKALTPNVGGKAHPEAQAVGCRP